MIILDVSYNLPFWGVLWNLLLILNFGPCNCIQWSKVGSIKRKTDIVTSGRLGLVKTQELPSFSRSSTLNVGAPMQGNRFILLWWHRYRTLEIQLERYGTTPTRFTLQHFQPLPYSKILNWTSFKIEHNALPEFPFTRIMMFNRIGSYWT